MEDVFLPIFIVGIIFVGLPWVVLHYLTKWKSASSMTREDEDMLDNLHDVARRLEDRLMTLERIVAADNPDFKPQRGMIDPDPASYRRSN
ncbi:MAG: envelope stress response membrane protein PspB [Sphingobium sp.]